jgi:GntR family transcriptional regulator
MKPVFDESLPLFFQTESFLRHRILSGEYNPGQKLPPEKEFCKQNGISQGTLRKALGKLQQEGLIERKVAKGTFVSPNFRKSDFPISMHLQGSFNELIFHGITSKVDKLKRGKKKLTEDEAVFFGASPGEAFPHFTRLKTVKDFPVYCFENLLAKEFGKKISRKELMSTPPLKIFQENLGIKLKYIKQVIRVLKAPDHIASMLKTNILEPLLHHKTYVYGENMKPLEIVDMYCRADRFELVVDFTDNKNCL